ncbi:MAG: iron-sulfur cluster-binding domain-containing protein [Bdellovibrionales bacterium]|nr:iron-sulfur cluster-binding domain-containing protein [Bdellovibrionales bacterium]
MKTQKIEFLVIDKIKQANDAYTFVLKPTNNLPFPYHSGQFITLFLDIEGHGEIQRSYSFSSSPLTDQYPHITVKKIDGGIVSTHLAQNIQIGGLLVGSQPLGKFFDPYSHIEENCTYFMFSAGSGVTPIYSIAQTILEASQSNIYFIYSNKNSDSIIFFNELELLEKKYPNRFFVKHHLSDNSQLNFLDRLESQDIHDYLTSSSKGPLRVYICGPKKYSDVIINETKSINIPKEKIHTESYTAIVHENLSSEFVIHIGDDRPAIPEEVLIKAKIDGELIEIKCSGEDTLLDALLNEGHSPPFSCMAGGCMACMAYVKKGEAWQEEINILTEKGVENGQVLTCQAFPTTHEIEIEYEE